MANKNLIKRALSVTANLPARSDQHPPGRDEAPVEREAQEPLPQRATPDTSQPQVVAPRTGPGSMMAFMTEQSAVHKEVVQLRERVSEFEGAEVARRLDPASIRASAWANRDDAHFATDSFAKLKAEIAGAGGNIQPIKVRPIQRVDGTGERFEIVYGHRRHRACLELGIPVFTLIQQEMKDAELFVEMERENRERADLSAWEQGVMYTKALEQGLFPSAKQLAAAIDRDMSNISRSMALARLPADVIKAFGSPLNLQFRWATALKDAHQRDPEGLLRTARDIAIQDPKPAPAAVFAILTRPAGEQGAGSAGVPAAEWKDQDGLRVATLTADRKKRVTLAFERPLDESERRKLVKLVDAFLGLKS